MTTIYVTHDQTEAMTLGSRVAVLRHGVLGPRAPTLQKYLGRTAGVGIRPENLEDAALVPDAAPESVLDVPVELREEVPQIPAIVARLDPRTGIREGERARLHVDLDSQHFFDPDTGDSLRGD